MYRLKGQLVQPPGRILPVLWFLLCSALMCGWWSAAASAQTFSNEKAWDDGTNFYFEASYTGTYPNFDVFLDTDQNAATGYSWFSIGADYSIQNTGVFKSTANGNAWDWSSQVAAATETVPQTGTIEFETPLTAIGNPAKATIMWQVLTSGWAGSPDSTVVSYVHTPSVPTGLTATAGNAQVALSWTASTYATSYNIYRSTTSGGEGSTAIATGVTTTTYTNTGLSNGTTYYYKVAAVDTGGTSAQSSEASAAPAGTPAAPTGLAAVAGNAQVSLTWTASSGATSYNIYRGTSSGSETSIATGVTTASYTNTGLTNGTAYYYKVAAVNSVGTSGMSSEVSATPVAASIPATPSGFAVTGGNAQVSLSWTATTGATSYNVYRGTSSGGETLLVSGVTAVSYIDTNVTNGTEYYYQLAAVNSAGTSGKTGEWSATPQSTSAPSAPAGLSATAGNAQVSLSWTASTGATSYNVYRGTSSGGETSIATGVTTTSYTNTGLTNGTVYYYKVAAVNANGTSGLSNEASATPQGTAPAAPTGLVATAGNAQVSLTWTASSGATSYNVYRGTSSGSETSIATGVTTTSYTNTGLTNGTVYYYKVAAVNASGTSALSSEVSATPQVSAPAAPTGLTATTGNAQISLNWTASSGATSYNVYRGTSAGGESTTALVTGITASTYTNTGLTNGTAYYYKVTAVNTSGTSSYSNEATATPSAPVVSVSVSPTTASVQTAGTQQFTASVTGSSNTAVTWQVNSVTGGNSTVGTVSTGGLYTAPSAVPSPASVMVTAISQADTTKSASASVTVTTAGSSTVQTLVPVSYATTSGSSGGEAVTSSIDILDESGTQNIFADYVQFQSKAATPVAIYTGTQNFTLPSSTSPSAVTSMQVAVNYLGGQTSEQTWTWSIYNFSTSSWVSLGTNSSAAGWSGWSMLYFTVSGTFSNYVQSGTGLIQLQTVSNNTADNADIDYEGITVYTGVDVSITPTTASLITSTTEQFNSTVIGNSNQGVNWAVNGIAGGNSTVGTINSTGLYTAPNTAPSPATVTVTATSQAQSSASASAVVTITQALSGSFYVSTTGSDSNPGTLASPWLTPQHAANVVGPGANVYLETGVYGQFDVNVSGSATGGNITFQNYNGEAVAIDGTGWTNSGEHGLIHIQNQSYITLKGLEIRNATSNSLTFVPNGVYVLGTSGPMNNIQILNCDIHNIEVTATNGSGQGNAHGIAIDGTTGTAAQAMTNVTVSGCTLTGMVTGWSETMMVKGNVDGFTFTNNLIYSNNNIGMDMAGGWGNSSNPALDMARHGYVEGNTVYSCSTKNNPAYNDYSCAGIYVDGGDSIIIERNISYSNDIGIQVASERTGYNSNYVTVRNNVVYSNNTKGIGIGGYNDTLTGGTTNCMFVNNTLYNNDTQKAGNGEFYVAWFGENNGFYNNIVYAGAQGLFVNHQVPDTAHNGATGNYNDYYDATVSNAASFWTAQGGLAIVGFTAEWQPQTQQDLQSFWSNPLFVSTTTPNFNIGSGSPALDTGSLSLGNTQFDPTFASTNNLPTGPVVGPLDLAGNARSNGSVIDMGAYQD